MISTKTVLTIENLSEVIATEMISTNEAIRSTTRKTEFGVEHYRGVYHDYIRHLDLRKIEMESAQGDYGLSQEIDYRYQSISEEQMHWMHYWEGYVTSLMEVLGYIVNIPDPLIAAALEYGQDEERHE